MYNIHGLQATYLPVHVATPKCSSSPMAGATCIVRSVDKYIALGSKTPVQIYYQDMGKALREIML